MLGIAVAIGVVWFAAQNYTPVESTEPTSRAVSGPIAYTPAAAPQPAPAPTVTAVAPAPTAVPAMPPPVAAAPSPPPNDPFAGVDVADNSVLRHIAGIEEKGRSRTTAPARERARTTPAASTVAPPAVQPAQLARESAPAPVVRDEAPAQAKAPNPIVVAQTPTATAVEPPRVAPPAKSANETVATRGLEPPPATTSAPAESAPAPAPIAAPPPAPAQAAPSNNNDRVLVAALGKAPQPQSTIAPLRLANRTVPSFPVEAVRAGVTSGRVVARLTIEADGRVSATQIISASPVGYFERESRRALANWRYDPPGQATTSDVELLFNRD